MFVKTSANYQAIGATKELNPHRIPLFRLPYLKKLLINLRIAPIR